MTENNKTGNNSMKAVPAEGGMFLYEKPEYLSPKTHTFKKKYHGSLRSKYCR